MRRLPAALLVALSLGWLGCAQSRTRVLPEEGEDFRRYHRIAVPSFVDPRGKGAEIADDISKALQTKLYNESIDRAALEQVLSKYKLDRDQGLGVEALEDIHEKTSADALVFGRMAPDWSSARITVIEVEMGSPVLRALILPKRGQKTFAKAEDVADETVRAFLRAD